MNTFGPYPTTRRLAWYREDDCSVADLAAALEPGDAYETLHYPASIQKGVPVYACRDLASAVDDPAQRRELLAEWARVLSEGSGVFVLQQAFSDTTPVDD